MIGSRSRHLPAVILAFSLLAQAPATAAPGNAPVASIVFVGKKNACPCTKKQITEGWNALKAGMGRRRIPVRRIQDDVHTAEADRHKKRRAYRALPAIYFLTSTGQVIELLEGIVTAADVQEVLKGR